MFRAATDERLTQVKYHGALVQYPAHRGEEVLAIAQVDCQIVLEIVADLLRLVVGEAVFASVVCVVSQTAVDDMLTNAVGETASVAVVGLGTVAFLDALNDCCIA
jgi:hypothetical protein